MAIFITRLPDLVVCGFRLPAMTASSSLTLKLLADDSGGTCKLKLIRVVFELIVIDFTSRGPPRTVVTGSKKADASVGVAGLFGSFDELFCFRRFSSSRSSR